jgi:acyl-CoA synthetase (AMP-forming)/AMP-acid ligase II
VAMTGLTEGDRYLMINPYFHMFGLKAGIVASIAAAATMLPEPIFDVDRVLTRVTEEAITVLPGPPTLYQSILDHPDRSSYDLSTLRVAVTGSADIPVELIRRVFEELPFPTIVSGYGLTEAGTANSTGVKDAPEAIATTVGAVRPGFEMRIVNEAGEDLPSGEAGEVLLRGPSVMSHYLDDPEATAAALTFDGWLYTGDIGVIDDAARLRIVGRAKDMFIVGGFNAYPAEIENAMLAHPNIASVAVIGVPDQRLGEVGMAFVVITDGATVGEREIVEWCRARMANYKVPRAVDIVDSLPLTATGKVVKDDLRARAAERDGSG